MANKGQVNTNTAYDSYFWVKWEQVGNQDIANNRTQIAWSCGVYCGHSFYSNAIKMSAVSINGTQVYGGGTYSNFSSGSHTIASGTMWIGHNADGTKTFSISPFTGWLYSNYNYSSNGGSYSLTAIPRQATITSAPDFTDLDNPTITYSNPAGNSVAALDACISLTGANDDIPYRWLWKDRNTYTFPLEEWEREVLRNGTPGPYRSVYVVLRTKLGDKYYYHSVLKTLYIAESEYTKPTISMTITPASTLSAPFDSLYIQGKSKVKASLDIGIKTGAKIDSSCINVEGVDYGSPYESGYLTQPGAQVVKCAVRDSRGFYGTNQQNITVIEYAKPMVAPLSSENAIQCYRSDGNGNRISNSTSLWIKAKRSYYTVEGKNTCALEWRWKPVAEQWDDGRHLWKDLISKTNTTTNEYNSAVSDVVFDLKASYTVQIRAIDDVGEFDIKTFEIPTQDVALHLGKGGKNVSIGTYCDYSEERTFYSEWKAIFGGGVVIGDKTLKEYIQDVINGGG